MQVSCNYLWLKWAKFNPQSDLVIAAKNKMSNYTKDDWKTMSNEATQLMNSLSYLCKNNIDIKDSRSQEGFNQLKNHLSIWFFLPTKDYFLQTAFLIKFDKHQKLFFDQFYAGLSTYIIKLIEEYA